MRVINISENYKGISKGFYSFISPANYRKALHRDYGCNYFCDGILSSMLIGLALKQRLPRLSFDFSSLADQVFSECNDCKLRILLVGGTDEESTSVCNFLQVKYPYATFSSQDGYPKDGFSAGYLEDLYMMSRENHVVILSLGSPLQEMVGHSLVTQGFKGTIFTSGAFISQLSLSGMKPYFPKWTNYLHLRFAWRLYKEPHTRKRFKSVFAFPARLLFDITIHRVSFRVTT